MVLSSVIWTGRLRARWILIGVIGLAFLYPASQFFRTVLLDGYTKTALEVLEEPTFVIRSLSDFLSDRDLGEYFVEGLGSTGARLVRPA